MYRSTAWGDNTYLSYLGVNKKPKQHPLALLQDAGDLDLLADVHRRRRGALEAPLEPGLPDAGCDDVDRAVEELIDQEQELMDEQERRDDEAAADQEEADADALALEEERHRLARERRATALADDEQRCNGP